MKSIVKVILILILPFLIFSCATQREINSKGSGRLILRDTSQVKESLEYELVVFDPGFDFWLSSNSFQKNQYSNAYLQSMNNLYVTEWNRRYSLGSRLIESYIDYSPFIEYDFELNYKLFMYFKYFEESNRIKLLPYRSR